MFGGIATVDISLIQQKEAYIVVKDGAELRIQGLETNFGDQAGVTPAFTALKAYVSRDENGTITALAPSIVDGQQKWLNVLGIAAGILNNILGDDGNVTVNFPGVGFAFPGVNIDLGEGYNRLRYNGANLDSAGTIINVQRLDSAPSSVGDFVRVLNYDLSKLGSKLVEVHIIPLSSDGEVTYTNAPASLEKIVIMAGAFSSGTAINKVSFEFAQSVEDKSIIVEIRKDHFNSRNLNTISVLEIFADNVTIDVNNLTEEDNTTINTFKTSSNTLTVNGDGRLIITAIDAQELSTTNNISNRLTLLSS